MEQQQHQDVARVPEDPARGISRFVAEACSSSGDRRDGDPCMEEHLRSTTEDSSNGRARRERVEAAEAIGKGIASALGPVMKNFDAGVERVVKSQSVLANGIDRLTRELDKLLEDAPLPFLVQYATKLSGVRKRVLSLNSKLRVIQMRIDGIDQILSGYARRSGSKKHNETGLPLVSKPIHVTQGLFPTFVRSATVDASSGIIIRGNGINVKSHLPQENSEKPQTISVYYSGNNEDYRVATSHAHDLNKNEAEYVATTSEVWDSKNDENSVFDPHRQWLTSTTADHSSGLMIRSSESSVESQIQGEGSFSKNHQTLPRDDDDKAVESDEFTSQKEQPFSRNNDTDSASDMNGFPSTVDDLCMF